MLRVIYHFLLFLLLLNSNGNTSARIQLMLMNK